MPSLSVAIDALRAKHGAQQFDDAVKKIKRSAKDVDKNIKTTDKAFNHFNKQLKSMALGLVGVAAAYKGIRFAQTAIKEFAAFEMQLANISTMLNSQTMNYLPKYEKQLSSLAVKYGVSTETLSKGLYDILSASIAAEDAISVLEISAKSAIGGLTDTGVAADALTTVLNAYGMEAHEATRVSDVLFATVKAGKITFGELAGSIGKVAAIAAAAGLSIEQVSAGIATMTRAGIQSDMAMTSLKAIITTFLSPAKEAIPIAAKYGLVLNANTLSTIGLTGVMELLKDATTEDTAAIFSNVRALLGSEATRKSVVALVKDHVKIVDSAGMQEEAFQKINRTTTKDLDRARESWKEFARVIGEEANPVVLNLAENLRDLGPALASGIGQIGKTRNTIVDMIVAIELASKTFSLETRVSVGLFDNAELEREIKYLEEIMRDVAGVGDLYRDLERGVKQATKLTEELADATAKIRVPFKDFDEAADYLLELSGSVAVSAESINGFVSASGKFTTELEDIAEKVKDVNIEIEDFGKTDLEKTISQFERMRDSLPLGGDYAVYTESLEALKKSLTELNELETKQEKTKLKKAAGEDITQLFAELEAERKLMGLTNEERERAIKLVEMEAYAKILLGDNSKELVDLYKQELIALQTAQDAKPPLTAQEEEEAAARRTEAFRRMYDDMDAKGEASYQNRKQLLQNEYDDYAVYIEDKKLLDEWYAERSNELELQKRMSGDDFQTGFTASIEQMQQQTLTWGEIGAQSAQKMQTSFGAAVKSMIMNGATLKEAMHGFAMSMLSSFVDVITKMIAMQVMASAFGVGVPPGSAMLNPPTPSAKGNIFSGGVKPFAKGDILSSPTIFPMSNGGVGLGGEAGSEAIMPLGRDNQGRLGVRTDGENGGGGNPLKIINVMDHSEVQEYLGSGDGERTIVNIMKRNSGEIQDFV